MNTRPAPTLEDAKTLVKEAYKKQIGITAQAEWDGWKNAPEHRQTLMGMAKMLGISEKEVNHEILLTDIYNDRRKW